jgi:hypothetical protein
VRIVRGPHMGETGTISGFPPRARRLETGAIVRGFEVRLETGEAMFVAQANVELFS